MYLTNPNDPTQSIMLININIHKDCYIELSVTSNNIIIIRLLISNCHLSLFNIYNDCTHDQTLDTLAQYFTNNLQQALSNPQDHMIWLSDFNHHYSYWEHEGNTRTYNIDKFITLLLNLIHEYEITLALLSYISTLFNSVKN